jgi:hypothetical protein
VSRRSLIISNTARIVERSSDAECGGSLIDVIEASAVAPIMDATFPPDSEEVQEFKLRERGRGFRLPMLGAKRSVR